MPIIRQTTEQDLPRMMEIVRDAQAYMKNHNIDQWQNNYPNEEIFLEDIQKGGSYVLVDDEQVIGFCYIGFHDDPNYAYIEEGKWLNDQPYGVIHRIAIDEKRKGNGYATYFFKYAEEVAKEKDIHNLRVDTHENNLSMQSLVTKNGFIHCGRVYMEDHSPRFAYQKLL